MEVDWSFSTLRPPSPPARDPVLQENGSHHVFLSLLIGYDKPFSLATLNPFWLASDETCYHMILCFYVYTLFLYLMDSKYCLACACKLLLSSFLKDTSADPSSKVFATCIPCCNKSKKRRALQALDQNRLSKKPDISRLLFEVLAKPSILLA